MRRDDPHTAGAGRHEDQFGAAADDADLEGEWNVTGANAWAYQLKAVAEANERIRAKAGKAGG